MEERKGISASVIKWIGMITMLIDHIGVTVILKLYRNAPDSCWGKVYEIARLIGRIAFPLYCFLLVEGFFYTKNKKKYAGRLFLFALLSEIPFNLAISGSFWYASANNVMWTMGIGILMLWGIDRAREKKNTVLAVLTAVTALVAAGICKVDYGCYGIAVILILYVMKEEPVFGFLGSCIVLCMQAATELFAMVGVVLVKLYNGKRGRQNKYVFYLFYPVHLLVLWIIETYLI